MTWQRATEIVAGRTYSWGSEGASPFVIRFAERQGEDWAFTAANSRGRLFGFTTSQWDMPYEQPLALDVVLAPVQVGELRPNDSGDKPTAVFVDGELVAVFTAGQQDRANAYAEQLKGGA